MCINNIYFSFFLFLFNLQLRCFMYLTRMLIRGDFFLKSRIFSRKKERGGERENAFMNNLSSSPRRRTIIVSYHSICVVSILCTWAGSLTKRSRTERPNGSDDDDDDDYIAFADDFDSRSETSFPDLMSMSWTPIRKSTACYKRVYRSEQAEYRLHHPGR